ncbi:MAG: thioredoxin domain-containing protein [Oscillospiraceae bacterium]|nr:thioredoxin domain-containing protein [Oscillospiraceae bacterium]
MTVANNSGPNRLINEKSPYLHQHATNPVDWFPWGEEAFDKARREDKPIFLSIGYSTCHWCHVMEQESFSDRQVAELLNNHFVSVKVDREERPDVDSVYMSVCTALTGSGGWPLTIIMTPDKKPFFAGTYLSRDNAVQLLSRMEHLWVHSRGELIESSEAIEQHIKSEPEAELAGATRELNALDGDMVLRAVEFYALHYDEKFGGFGSAPKFPSPHNLMFLLEYDRLVGSEQARDMALTTLRSMYRGGIFDHIAGGFSRYATDDKWLVPHFEKMLYDNALLALTYLTAYEQYAREPSVGASAEFCKTAAQKIFSWAFAEIHYHDASGNVGGFYCGQDAATDGVEGKYYLLRYDEITGVLGEQNGERYCRYFGITKKGNAVQLGNGVNVPNLIRNPRHADDEEFAFVQECNRELYHYRRERTPLRTDTKIVTSWNALMILALVKAYEVLGDASYLEAAKATERFVSERLSFAGRLYVRWCDGDVLGNGKLDDYAGFALALTALYRATGRHEYLDKSVHYADVMVQRFFDFTAFASDASSESGGFYFYADDDEQLISRPKEIYDAALPSGNAVAFMVLDVLREYSGEAKWHELYKKQARFIASYASRHPMGCPFSLITALRTSVSKRCQGGECRR